MNVRHKSQFTNYTKLYHNMDFEHIVFICWAYVTAILEGKLWKRMYVIIDVYFLKCLCCDVTATTP